MTCPWACRALQGCCILHPPQYVLGCRRPGIVLPIFQKPGSFRHPMVLNPRSPTPRSPCSLYGKGDIPTSSLPLTAAHTSTVLWGWQAWSLIGPAQWRAQGLAELGCQGGMRVPPRQYPGNRNSAVGLSRASSCPSQNSTCCAQPGQGAGQLQDIPSAQTPLLSPSACIPSLNGSSF